jgi:hypothetical protein
MRKMVQPGADNSGEVAGGGEHAGGSALASDQTRPDVGRAWPEVASNGRQVAGDSGRRLQGNPSFVPCYG